ncbi:hypothetical protein NSQ99_07185 [Paenibacillus sp. FSL W7-1287]|uniref:hypothetical protein n=2 Tax=Paenibacillus sp. FSL W7-1287 TaxID=2954538 RepID=UPI0030F9DBCD
MSDMQVQQQERNSNPVLPAEKRKERAKKRRSKLLFVNFMMLWLLLIACGLYGAHTYMNHVEQSLADQLSQETEQRLIELETSFNTKLSELDSSYNEKIAALGEQIEELNQLLTFVKDNSSNNNDNSNQLYSQINDIKAQLQKLQKSMELLK